MRPLYSILFFLLCVACAENNTSTPSITVDAPTPKSATSLVILGTIQDAGSPHIACKKECCKHLFDIPDANRQVVSLGLFDADANKKYLFEATPDISRQVKSLRAFGHESTSELPDGIFITHAHIGHYSGLMYLGKEATNAQDIPVYAMPRMTTFIKNNGPWSQLVTTKNILLKEVTAKQPVLLSKNLTVTPFLVPHRDEYSETVGYKITGPNKTALFIPDIDKWEQWELSIIEEIKKVDYAFLDATFFDAKELNNRDMSEIPHPFIVESMQAFKNLSIKDKKKVIFIHFNHTNPVIDSSSNASKKVEKAGFQIAKINDSFKL